FERYSCPSKHGEFYYYSHNTGLQNQSVIFRQASLKQKGIGEVFLDPNGMSADGTTSISMQKWTEDGSILAYGVSEKGSDWNVVRFRTADKNDLKDFIEGIKHSELAWLKDNSGVFYSKYPHPKATEGKSAEKHEYHSLYFHRMGTDGDQDILIYDRGDSPDNLISGEVTEDGRYLLIYVESSDVPFNMLYYHDLSTSGKISGKIKPKPLFDKLDARYTYIDHDNDSMLILTNRDALMFKLIRVSLKNGSIWDVVPENKQSVLYDARPFGKDRLLLTYIEDVKTCAEVECKFKRGIITSLYHLATSPPPSPNGRRASHLQVVIIGIGNA
ncbi:peptidase, S9A family, beta-propeller domain protein, partial [Ancylostoma caninum]